MKAAQLVTWILVMTVAGCTDEPSRQVSIPPPAPPPVDGAVWEIGDDIAGKEVMIDGKVVVIPEDVAETKRKMDAVAKEKMDEMDALQNERLERFNDPDMKP